MAFALVLSREEAQRVAARRKTQLRRLARTDPLTGRMRHSMTMEPGAIFDVYPGAAAGEARPVCAIEVVAVREQQLGAVTFEEAKAEGWRTRAEFADHWMARHDRRWPLLEEQPCPTCEGWGTVDGVRCSAGCDDVGAVMAPAELDDDQVLDVFVRVHGERLVRVVEFAVEPHRYLHRQSDALYTSDPRQALPDSGEAVDAATLERYARENRAAHAAGQHRRLAEALEVEQLRALARDQGIDVRELRRAEERRLLRSRQREASYLRQRIAGRIDDRAA
jgi:hypothetical protein